ncbi:hypothetical protein KKI24_28920 [bacterium]|nr:hypothetical protein [bacterium]
MEVLEPDMLLKSNVSGIIIHKDEAAINERIRFWASIKKGDFWGKPWKGNQLHFFHFRPPSQLTFTLLEMEIAEDLPNQVPIKIFRINCKSATSTDKYTRLTVLYQSLLTGKPGLFNEDIIDRKAA